VPFGPFVLRGPGQPYFVDLESRRMFSPGEHATFVVVGMAGAMLGMFLTGTFVAVVSARDGATVTEQVTSFCRKFNVATTSRKQMLQYFANAGDMSGPVPKGDLFAKLSPNLLTELLIDVHGKWLMQFPFAPDLFSNPFTHIERNLAARKSGTTLLSKIALLMVPALFVPREWPPGGRLYVISKGVAVMAISGVVKRPGDSWGAYLALLDGNKHSRSTRGTFRAVTNLQVLFVDGKKVRELSSLHPELHQSFLRMRLWALFLKLRINTPILAKRARGATMEGLLKQTSNTLIQQTPRLLAPNVSETNGPQSDAPTASINGSSALNGGQNASALMAMERRLGRVEETLQRLCTALEKIPTKFEEKSLAA